MALRPLSEQQHRPGYSSPRPSAQGNELPPLREVVSRALMDDEHAHVDQSHPSPSLPSFSAGTYPPLDPRSTFASPSSRQAGPSRRPSSSSHTMSDFSPRFAESGRDPTGAVHLPSPFAHRPSPAPSTPLSSVHEHEMAPRPSLPPIFPPEHSSIAPPLVARMHGPREPTSYEPVDPASSYYSSMRDDHRHPSREGPQSPYPPYSPGQYRGEAYHYSGHGSLEMSSPLGYAPSNSTHSEPRTRKRRGNLPKPVTDLLKAWFRAHQSHPYPSEEEKQLLMCQTGLTITQLSNWFINARRRELPEMDRQARANAITQQAGGTESDDS